MKLTNKISWLMGRVQRSLFPHLNECLPTPLTEQEKRLSIDTGRLFVYIWAICRMWRRPWPSPVCASPASKLSIRAA